MYEFATMAEYVAFMRGVEESSGWLEYEVLKSPDHKKGSAGHECEETRRKAERDDEEDKKSGGEEE